MPFDPWEQWLVIHGGELLEDGRPRFRILIVIVARQNGKTHVLVVLSLRWLFVDFVPLVLGTSTNLDYARESWEKAVSIAQANDALAGEIPRRGGVRRVNGEQTLTSLVPLEQLEAWAAVGRQFDSRRCRYKIAASNRKGGRSLTIDRLVLDELREHHSWEAWNAAEPATNAVPDAQIWAITNQGDDKSIVLESHRSAALEYIETGVGDPRLGLFEWSAPDGSDPEDVAAIAAANPNLGHRVDLDAILGAARRAKAAGGEQLAGFRTEMLCQRVPVLDPVVDVEAWRDRADPAPFDEGSRLAVVLDVSLDLLHATLYAAAKQRDGRVRIDPLTAWAGPDCTQQARAETKGWLRRVRARRFGWFPNGPAAAIGADFASDTGWAPRGCKIEEIRRDLNGVCMGFADLVKTGELVRSDDPLLTAQITSASKLWVGDGWRFTRKAGHIDAGYAAAGAVHLARSMPRPRKPLVLVAAEPSPPARGDVSGVSPQV